MTPTTPTTTANDQYTHHHHGEPFWSIVVRRSRYTLSILLLGIAFWFLAYPFVAPPPQFGGIALFVWSNANPFLAAAVLLVLLLAGTALAMTLCHPDSPHTGMFCALAALAAVAIRGDTIYMLLRRAEDLNALPQLYRALALECALWLLILASMEAFTRFLWPRFFRNHHWIARGRMDPAIVGPMAPLYQGDAHARNESHIPPPLAALLALTMTCALAFLLIFIFMQSQDKGQVLFAAFAAFALAAMACFWAFPDAPAYVFWAAVPITAAVGYELAAPGGPFPGHAASPLGRALPIDYISAGGAGAIVGYYAALKARMHTRLSKENH